MGGVPGPVTPGADILREPRASRWPAGLVNCNAWAIMCQPAPVPRRSLTTNESSTAVLTWSALSSVKPSKLAAGGLGIVRVPGVPGVDVVLSGGVVDGVGV